MPRAAAGLTKPRCATAAYLCPTRCGRAGSEVTATNKSFAGKPECRRFRLKRVGDEHLVRKAFGERKISFRAKGSPVRVTVLVTGDVDQD